MKKIKKLRTSITIPEPLLIRAQDIADVCGQTFSSLVEMLLKKHVGERK